MKSKFQVAVLLLAALGVCAWSARPAQAVPEFKKQFDAKYPELAKASEEAKCNICHYGKSKKMKNDYGEALAEFLKKDNYKADRVKAEAEAVKKECSEAFGKVEGKKSKSGKTFGELLKAGKLPGTAPE